MSAIKNFIITFCISVLLLGLLAYFIMSYAMDNVILTMFNSPNDPDTTQTVDNNLPDDNPVTETDADGNPVITEEPNENSEEAFIVYDEIEADTFTVLLIGTDYQPDILNDYDLSEINENISGFPIPERPISADSIVMLHINKDLKKFVVSSIPSNMQVLVDGVYTKLGILYNDKGIDFLCGKVTAVTGIKIDYYASIALSDFKDIIDEIGGITYDVPINMEYEDPEQELYINLSKGEQLLDGDKALQLLRYRSYSNDDVTRMSVISSFGKIMLKKLTSYEYYTQAVSLYSKFIEKIETNFTESTLIANIDLIFAYSQMEIVDIIYPGAIRSTKDDTYFEPNIQSALTTYREYKN